jgi:hypothetical protein
MRFRVLSFILLAASLSQAAPQSNALLDGSVVNAITDDPLPVARLKLAIQQQPAQQPPGEALYTKPDAQGNFRFTNLEPKLYMLSVESPGFFAPDEIAHRGFGTLDLRPHASNVYGGEGSSEFQVTSAVNADGSAHVTVRVAMMPCADVTGKITDPNGAPMAGVQVRAYMVRLVQKAAGNAPVFPMLPDGQHELFPLSGTPTSDSGEFRIARLAPGAYYFLVQADQSTAWRKAYRSTYFPQAIDLASAKPVELAAGQHAQADIRIASVAGVHVAGRIVRPAAAQSESEALPSIQMALVPEAITPSAYPNPFTILTVRDEFDVAEVMPGKYTLMAVIYNSLVHRKAVYGLTKQIEVGERGLAGLTLELQPIQDLAGEVVFSGSCTPRPTQVSVRGFMPWGPTSESQAITEADGKFVLTGLFPGMLRVTATPVGTAAGFSGSMKLGDREVSSIPFEYPIAAPENLRITMECNESRRSK